MASIEIKVNGQCLNFRAEATLEHLLDDLGHKSQSVAVAVNQKFIPRQAFGQTKVQDQDAVEILAPMAGG